MTGMFLAFRANLSMLYVIFPLPDLCTPKVLLFSAGQTVGQELGLLMGPL